MTPRTARALTPLPLTPTHPSRRQLVAADTTPEEMDMEDNTVLDAVIIQVRGVVRWTGARCVRHSLFASHACRPAGAEEEEGGQGAGVPASVHPQHGHTTLCSCARRWLVALGACTLPSVPPPSPPTPHPQQYYTRAWGTHVALCHCPGTGPSSRPSRNQLTREPPPPASALSRAWREEREPSHAAHTQSLRCPHSVTHTHHSCPLDACTAAVPTHTHTHTHLVPPPHSALGAR